MTPARCAQSLRLPAWQFPGCPWSVPLLIPQRRAPRHRSCRTPSPSDVPAEWRAAGRYVLPWLPARTPEVSIQQLFSFHSTLFSHDMFRHGIASFGNTSLAMHMSGAIMPQGYLNKRSPTGHKKAYQMQMVDSDVRQTSFQHNNNFYHVQNVFLFVFFSPNSLSPPILPNVNTSGARCTYMNICWRVRGARSGSVSDGITTTHPQSEDQVCISTTLRWDARGLPDLARK
jgi:hypothetical protein